MIAEEAEHFRAETDIAIAIGNQIGDEMKSRIAYLIFRWMHAEENPNRCTKNHAKLYQESIWNRLTKNESK